MSEAQRLARHRQALIRTLKDALVDARRFNIRDDLGVAEMMANRLWPQWQSHLQGTRQANIATRQAKHDLLFAKAVIDGSIADIEAVDDGDMDDTLERLSTGGVLPDHEGDGPA